MRVLDNIPLLDIQTKFELTLFLCLFLYKEHTQVLADNF